MVFGLDPNLYTSDGLLKSNLVNKCLNDDNNLICYKYTLYPVLNKVIKGSKVYIIYDKYNNNELYEIIKKYFNEKSKFIKYIKINQNGIFYNKKYFNKFKIKKMLISGIILLKYYKNLEQNLENINITLDDINKIIFYNIFQGYDSYINIMLYKYLINYSLNKNELNQLNDQSKDKSGNINYDIFFKNKLLLLKSKEKYTKYKENLRDLYNDIKKQYKKIYQ